MGHKSNPCVQAWRSETGEHIVASAGELHLEICLNVRTYYASLRLSTLMTIYTGLAKRPVPLKISDPVVSYSETVKAESSIVAPSKSPNKHNRLFVRAILLNEELTKAIEGGVINSRDNFKD